MAWGHSLLWRPAPPPRPHPRTPTCPLLQVLNAFVKYLQPEGTIYLSHHLPFSKETLAKDFGLKVAHKEHQKCKWSQSTNVWWELQHLDAPAQ